MGNKILLTGSPGCGKTTLVRHVVASLSRPAGGFYTQEVREHGKRLGFEIVTLDGRRGILAHVDIRSGKRVGKYGVDVAALDALGVGAVQDAISQRAIVIIDEIGPMELLSEQFRGVVRRALAHDQSVLGTIALRTTPFTDSIKAMTGVSVVEVRPDNRETLLADLVSLLEAS